MVLPRCPCGYTVFYDKVSRAAVYKPRWRKVRGRGGFGATPFATAFGDFGRLSWGKFFVEVTQGLLNKTCKSCHRIRRSIPIGGGTPMGSWQAERTVYVLLTDVVSAGCLIGRFETAEGQRFEVQGHRAYVTAPFIEGTPVEAADQLPVGAVIADTVLSFTLPDSAALGSYHFLLRDRCLDTLTSLYSLRAEAA